MVTNYCYYKIFSKCASTLCHMAECNATLLCRWQKLLSICCKIDHIYIKKNFLPTIFQFQVRDSLLIICRAKNYVYTKVKGKYRHAKLWWDRHFVDQIFMPCGILQHDVACRRHTSLTSTLLLAFATEQSRIVLHSAIRHSVNTHQAIRMMQEYITSIDIVNERASVYFICSNIW